MQSEKEILNKIPAIDTILKMKYKHITKYSELIDKQVHTLSDCWTFKSDKLKEKLERKKFETFGYECTMKQLVWVLAGGLYAKRKPQA